MNSSFYFLLLIPRHPRSSDLLLFFAPAIKSDHLTSTIEKRLYFPKYKSALFYFNCFWCSSFSSFLFNVLSVISFTLIIFKRCSLSSSCFHHCFFSYCLFHPFVMSQGRQFQRVDKFSHLDKQWFQSLNFKFLSCSLISLLQPNSLLSSSSNCHHCHDQLSKESCGRWKMKVMKVRKTFHELCLEADIIFPFHF